MIHSAKGYPRKFYYDELTNVANKNNIKYTDEELKAIVDKNIKELYEKCPVVGYDDVRLDELDDELLEILKISINDED